MFAKVRGPRLGVLAALAGAFVALATPAAAQPSGQALYEARCKSCHEGGVERAPDRADLGRRAKGDLIAAMSVGVMKPMAEGLTPEQIDAIATHLTSAAPAAPAPPPAAAAAAPRPPRGGGVQEMPPVTIRNGVIGTDTPCATHPPIKATPGDWANTGLDDRNSRFQRRPGLSAADVPKLKVKWSFAMTGGGQPVVVGDWLFVTNRSGKLYALDAKTGCVHWALNDVVARTTPIVVKNSISPSGWAMFVGQVDRIVKAFDAQTGKVIWKSEQLESHGSSLLTGSPIIAGDKLLVPISSIEEATSMAASYACCTFRGSLAGLDLKTGRMLWKTHTIHEPKKVVREKESGQQVTGPAGAAVWAAPSIDMKRGLAYIVTGDSYTDVDTKGADAVMALEIATGKIRWETQVTENDNFIMGCGPNSKSGNCPTPLGPDHDFGATPVMMTLKNGKQILVAGQKSGEVYGMDPDTGKVIWETRVGEGGALGGVEWGIGADDSKVYVPISDLTGLFAEFRAAAGAPGSSNAKPGVYALDPASGKILWSAPAPKAPCVYASDQGRPSRCARAQPAAPAVMPGFVFEGGLDGWFRAYDSGTGKIVWEHSTTAQKYDTVNGVKGHPGGGIDGMGPTIANGMVYIISGNNGAARVGSNGINVLLAYSVDGK